RGPVPWPEACSCFVAMVDKPKILYVEDDLLTRRAFRRLLRNEWEVFDVGTGTEALFLAHEHDFPVVVSDYVLEESNGIQVLKSLRKHLPNAVFILVSGASDDFLDRQDELTAATIAHFVAKPWDNQSFMELLR